MDDKYYGSALKNCSGQDKLEHSQKGKPPIKSDVKPITHNDIRNAPKIITERK